jgi:hypothetical protein
MKNKTVLLGMIAVMLLATTEIAMAVGNGWTGYNWKAKIFVGTGLQWCKQKFDITDPDECNEILEGPYSNDKLVMKWTQAWQDAVFGPDGFRYNGDELPWTTDAWEDNEWNGNIPGGSGEVSHQKIVWVGTPCDESNPNWRPGGECIWGQFEVLMDQGTNPAGHFWDVHAIPTGYGV